MLRVESGANLYGQNSGTQIVTGNSTSAPLIAYASGAITNPVETFGSGTQLLVQFTTDGSNTDEGWSASWSTFELQCDGTITLTANSGSFDDRSGANPVLSFSAFEFGTYDTLRVYDGLNANGTLLLEHYGSSLPNDMFSSAGGLFIEMETNAFLQDDGFTTSWVTPNNSTCQGTQEYFNESGSISDGSGSGSNSDNLQCYWLIEPQSSQPVELEFTEFSTEGGYDWVILYDGPTTNHPIIAEYSGSTLPPTLIADSGSAMFVFETNESVQSDG